MWPHGNDGAVMYGPVLCMLVNVHVCVHVCMCAYMCATVCVALPSSSGEGWAFHQIRVPVVGGWLHCAPWGALGSARACVQRTNASAVRQRALRGCARAREGVRRNKARPLVLPRVANAMGLTTGWVWVYPGHSLRGSFGQRD